MVQKLYIKNKLINTEIRQTIGLYRKSVKILENQGVKLKSIEGGHIIICIYQKNNILLLLIEE